MADNDKFVPKIFSKDDDEIIIELRNEVFMSVAFASEKKLRVQMWRQSVMLPQDEGNIFTQSFRDKLVKQARDGFNEPGKPDNIPNIEADIGLAATLLGSRAEDGKSLVDKLLESEDESITQKLITLGEKNAFLFHTPEQVAHAACPRAGHIEVFELDSRQFRMWLRSEFRRTERERMEQRARDDRDRMAENRGAQTDYDDSAIQVPRPPAVPPASVTIAVEELSTTAVVDGPEEEVYLRVAGADGKIYHDLANEAWEVVEISKEEGWKVIPSTEVPVRFVRSNIMQPLPRPEPGGSVEELRRLLTLGTESEDDKAAWALTLGWLMQALNPALSAGQYPVLTVLGGHGTAKSTTIEMLRELVDPAVVKHEHTYKDTRDVYIECVACWVLALDNISKLPDWLSDTICRLSTGGGFKTRSLFTNRQLEVFRAQRPVIMNGISDIATRADILDRALMVDLPVIDAAKRRYIRELWSDFYAQRPRILGALYDALSFGLNVVEDIDLSGQLPRMADFARWAVATEPALGLDEGTFMEAYGTSRDSATETALESEPIWRVLKEFAMDYGPDDMFVGTMKLILQELNLLEKDDALKRSKDWPKTERGLSEIIKRLGPALREFGIYVQRAPGSRRDGRRYEVFYVDPESEDG